MTEEIGQGADATTDDGDSASMGALRTLVTVLVVAHHSLIAYVPNPPVPATATWSVKDLLWTAFPVVDKQRFEPFGLFMGFNDVFFMSLMFFISGLFVWPSLTRKGFVVFVRDRILRLGVPFAVAAALLAPLAYYPSYLQGGGAPDPVSYAKAWLSLGSWPAGPAWFLWVLLAFHLVMAILLTIAPVLGRALGAVSSHADRRPWTYAGALIVVSGAGYLTMNLVLGYDAWIHWGPFFVQAGRGLHYAAYFVAGIGVGAAGLSSGLLDPQGKLARRWWLWPSLGPIAFVALAAAFLTALGMKFQPHPHWTIALCFLFAIACALISLGFVSLFVRFVKRTGPVLGSLRSNAYGIYLLHYVFAIWIQFALLDAPLSGGEKGGIVVATTLVLSWATSALLRSFPGIRRVI